MSGEFIDVLSPSALANLQKANTELTTMIRNVGTLNASKVGTPSQGDASVKNLNSEYLKQQKIIADLQLKLQKASQQQQANAEKTRLAEVRLAQQRERAFDNYDKQLQKEQQQLQKSENVYNKIQAKINAMIPTYNNLQAKQKLGVSLTAKEEAQLKLLESRLVKYQNILKETDAQIGKHGRSVGDYAKGTSNLSNSIGQISRELPNFGQSFSVGVLSLTNNVGALIDGIKQVKQENKNLIEQGEEAKSVFSQLKTAIFSWQTALFIAIGVFSAYSKEISDWVESLWKGSEAIQNVAKAQKEMNKVRLESNKSTIDEKTRINELISVSKNQSISLEERQIALKKLRSEYPFYFKDLKDEAILNGDVAGSLNKLALAVDKRALADKKDELIIKNKERLLELQYESNKKLADEATELEKFDKAYNRKIRTREQYLADVKKKFTNLSDWLIVGDDQKFKDQLIETAGLQKINAEAQKEVNQLRAESIGLDFQLDKTKDKQIKQKREKIHLDFAEVESQYALKLAILERQKAEINDRVENEDLNLDIRLKAREEFSEKSIEILKLETDKEKELLLEKYNDDLNKNNLAYKNKDITAKEWATNIGDIQNRFNNEKSKSDVVYSTKWEALMREDLDFFKKIQQQKKGFSDAYLDDIYKKELELSKKTSDNQDLTMRKRQEAYEKNTRLQQDYNEELRRRELLNQVDLLQIQEINKRYDDLNATLIASSKIDSPLAKAQKDTDKFIDTLTSGQLESGLSSIGLASAKMFLDFDRNGETTFDKLFAGAENLQEKFAVTFSAIADIAKDVFSYISEQSNKNFENELNNLTKQKEVAILFAGDSASARDEIERQYDVKQREIRRRQAKAEKEQAKFSIIINTAQAIVGYLAKQQYGFALVAAAIGAVQLGVVSAQKLPEFYKGTDNAPEGWALTQEKGREIITDSKGRIKSKGSDKGAQLTYLNKGDKVFTNSETLMFDNNLNNILSSKGISSGPSVVVNNANLERKLDELINVTFNKPVPNLSFINGDFRRTVQSGHTTQIIENKRINFQGQKV